MSITNLTNYVWIPKAEIDCNFPGSGATRGKVINIKVTAEVKENYQEDWVNLQYQGDYIIYNSGTIGTTTSTRKSYRAITLQRSESPYPQTATYVEWVGKYEGWEACDIYDSHYESYGEIRNIRVKFLGGDSVEDTSLINWLLKNGELVKERSIDLSTIGLSIGSHKIQAKFYDHDEACLSSDMSEPITYIQS